MTSSAPNAELVGGIRAGCPHARARLFESYAASLRRVLSRELGHDAELDDLLHDVFVAAFECIGQLAEPDALPAWLSQIAINIARGHVRRCMRRRALFELLGLAATERRGHLDHVASEASLAVRELIGRLPPAARAPFALRYLAEMELSEVAATCTLSVPTVKRRLVAARRKLARFYELPAAGPATSRV